MKKLQVLLVCGVAALIGSTTAHAAEKTYSIGGDLELDLTKFNGGKLGEGGRVKLNATGMSKNDAGYFVKGVGQILLPISGDVGFDDVYLQAGRDTLNFQIGRFEGFSAFGKGKDTLVEHAGGVQTYEANKARGRFNGGDALHAAVNGSNGAVSYQLGVVSGESDDGEIKGYRPAVSFKLGRASMTAVYDVLEDSHPDGDDVVIDKYKGFGLTGGLPLGGGTLGASYAAGTATDNGSDEDIKSTSLHYTRASWGVGYIYSTEDNGAAENFSVNTLHAAYTMPLFGVKDASVTFAGSTSKADLGSGVDSDDVHAARVRFNYSF